MKPNEIDTDIEQSTQNILEWFSELYEYYGLSNCQSAPVNYEVLQRSNCQTPRAIKCFRVPSKEHSYDSDKAHHSPNKLYKR